MIQLVMLFKRHSLRLEYNVDLMLMLTTVYYYNKKNNNNLYLIYFTYFKDKLILQ